MPVVKLLAPVKVAKVAPLAVEISEAQLWTAISVVVGTLATAVGFLLKNWIKEKEDRLLEMKTQRDDYKRIAGSTVEAYEQLILRQLGKRGIVPALALADVVPEHHSPTTEKQSDQAEFATIKAKRAAADVALEQLIAAEEASSNALPTKPPEPVPVVIVEAKATVPVKLVEDEK